MPYLALAEGVSNKPWAEARLVARAAYGLKADPAIQNILRDKLFGPHTMSSSQASTTLLAWCARYGVKSSVRRQLGKDSDPRDKSMLVYSRAALSHVSMAESLLFRAIGNLQKAHRPCGVGK
eukprot:5393697-Amphidinium_carterae.1